MKERRYVAFYDNGRDYGEFVFYSLYRKGSKANMVDALNVMARKYGLKLAYQTYIKRIKLYPD